MSEILSSTTPVPVVYENYRGEIAARRIVPGALWFGKSEFHKGEDGEPKAQWFIICDEPDTGKRRDFALEGFLAWGGSAAHKVNDLFAELRILRAQRMRPERERELLEANNRLLERARKAERALRERDAADFAKLDGDSLDAIVEVIGSSALYNQGKSAMRQWFLGRLRRLWNLPEPASDDAK